MPSVLPGIIDWLQPGAIGAGFAIVWAEIKGLNRRLDEQNKRLDELRVDMKEIRAEHRADNRALKEKLDRLIENRLLTAKQS